MKKKLGTLKVVADSADDAPPAAGHNSIAITPEQFSAAIRTLAPLEAARDKAKANLKAARKQLRADGFLLVIFDAMRKLADLPRLEQITNWTHSVAYLKYLRSPIGSQLKMDFDDVDPFKADGAGLEAQAVEDAEGDGYRLGLAGEAWEDSNPHPVSSKVGQAWIKGYREGVAAAVKAMGSDDHSGS